MDRESNAVPEREAAAAWHDQLHRDKVSEETRQSFNEWLAASPRHAELYASVHHAWVKLQSASSDPLILALRQETALRLTRRTSAWVRPLGWAVASVFLALGAVLLVLSVQSRGDLSSFSSVLRTFRLGNPGVYQTATGERLAFSLPDGSQVTLDTQSELRVSFSVSERSVRLVRGQAFFEVAKDASRPFAVDTGTRRLIAVGTAFDVRLDGDRLKVTMVEGTVRVEHTGQQIKPPLEQAAPKALDSAGGESGASQSRSTQAGESGATALITAGEQLITDTQRDDLVRATDPELETSWRRGQVLFDNTRLADAVAELNRYSSAKIELADPELADLHLSGAFASGRPTVFIEAVTTYFPVEISRSDDRVVVLRKKR
jgi:transmembrane sensor